MSVRLDEDAEGDVEVIEQTWFDEAERRAAEVESGQVVLADWEDVRERITKKLDT